MSAELSKAIQPGQSGAAATKEEDEGASSGLSLTALFRALRRRWLLASLLCLSLGGLAFAAVWCGLPPPKHVAQAILHVSAVKPHLIDGSAQYGGDFMIYQQSQKALLSSRLVLTTTLRQPKVNELRTVQEQSNPVDWLQQELKIDFKSGPEYMRLSLSGERPEELKVLVGAITDAYLRVIVDRERNKQLTHLDQLKDIQSRYEETLRRKRKSVREMSVAVGSGDPQVIAIKQKYASEALGEAQKELIKLKSELRRLQLELSAQVIKEKDLAKSDVPAALVEKEIQKDATILQERARESELEKKLAVLRREYVRGEDDPSLAPLRRERADIQAGIEARRKTLWPLITEQLREQSRQDAKLTLVQLREREAFLKGLETQLGTEVEGLRKQTTSLNVGQLDIENFKQEIAQAEKIAEQVTAKAEVLNVELLAPARVTLVEEPYVTQENPTKRMVKVAALAEAVVLFVVLWLVGWLEHRRHRIQGVREVEDELGLRVLGTIPSQPERGRRPGGQKAYHSQQGLLDECVDATRTRLIRAADGEGVRVVMVTSAVPGEGKTTLSRHLAISLTRAGRRTLLVDGDLRLPSLHRFFDLAPQPGLAEVLRGEADVAVAVQPVGTEGLWVMTAGDADLRAIQALARQPLLSLVARVRQQYDCVIIDSAPILPVADGLQLGQQVDGVILSVLRGVSQVPAVRAARQRLGDLNIRVLGAVVNGADLKSVYGPWYSGGCARLYQLPPGAISSAVEDETWYSRSYAKVPEQLPSGPDAGLPARESHLIDHTTEAKGGPV